MNKSSVTLIYRMLEFNATVPNQGVDSTKIDLG